MITRALIISLVVAVSLPSTLLAQSTENKVNWVHVNDMEKLVKADPKPILMDVYTSWCGPCKMMMAKTFTNQNVVNYVNKNFHAVKFNAEGNDTITFQSKQYVNPNYNPAKTRTRNGTHQFAGIASVNGRLAYPTLVYLNEKLEMLAPIQGYLTPEKIEPMLSYFGDGHYKDQPDYGKWVATFKSKFFPGSGAASRARVPSMAPPVAPK